MGLYYYEEDEEEYYPEYVNFAEYMEDAQYLADGYSGTVVTVDGVKYDFSKPGVGSKLEDDGLYVSKGMLDILFGADKVLAISTLSDSLDAMSPEKLLEFAEDVKVSTTLPSYTVKYSSGKETISDRPSSILRNPKNIKQDILL